MLATKLHINPTFDSVSVSDDELSPRSLDRRAGIIDAVAQAAFTEKKWVWVVDKEEGYVAGYITKDMGDTVEVHLNDDTTRVVRMNETENMNPPKFDKVEDMANLTYLNESSVIHNLRQRYQSNLIYTYSGLFLVAVNPYRNLPIYSEKVVRAYKAKRPIACDKANTSQLGQLEQQILQANPILEAFGNAQTIRNNNSSRFGKFIRIEFNSRGQIAGANIERYLLEKSRVTSQTSHERNYHIFYQLMKGAPSEIKAYLLLDGTLDDYRYTKTSRKDIDGVDDAVEFNALTGAMDVVGFTKQEQLDLFRVVAAVLHLGNIQVTGSRDNQAYITDKSIAEKVCNILGMPVDDFVKSLLKPHVKAGREWVAQARTKEQVIYSIDALAKALYERNFSAIVDRINQTTDRPTQKETFIGVLDIAGFEIFEDNSFEQLCINYTNEKLQQFFNHNMFVLEQEEYKNENINWKFIDFGMDLQPTIDLIEKTNPVGILSCLDEECVMPKATDKTFMDKLNRLWNSKSPKYSSRRFTEGFVLQHYAAKVEYCTTGWLDKNKDPLNENVSRLLAQSTEPYIATLFSSSSSDAVDTGAKNRSKKQFLRTVGQRHKEQLHILMQQLYSTKPRFVRCIVPNGEKAAGLIEVPLVLDQLRCNGVLEGIRICRAGFPNRLTFIEFRQRYEVLSPGLLSKSTADDNKIAEELLKSFGLDNSLYRIGNTKVFFRAGVLAELEEIRETKLSQLFTRFQAHCRGRLARRDYAKLSEKLDAIKLIQKNARVYMQLKEWPWWKLYSKSKPMLNVTRMDAKLKEKDDNIRELEYNLKNEIEKRQVLEVLVQQLQAENKLLQDERRKKDVSGLERERKSLQVQLAEVKARLESELAHKQEEGAARKRLTMELQELQLKYEAEQLKTAKANENLTSYKSRADGTMSRLENANLERLKAEKNEEFLRLQIKELEDSLADAINDRKNAEIRVKTLEDRVAELEAKIDDDAAVFADFDLLQKRLQDDFADERERYKRDIEEQEYALEQTRRKYQKELERLANEVELERNNLARIREENKLLQKKVDNLLTEAEEESHTVMTWKREKEMLENKVADLAQLYNDAMTSHDELQSQANNLLAEVRELRVALDEAESEKIQLERAKRVLEMRLEDIDDQYQNETQDKQAAVRSISVLDVERNELRQLLDEQQDVVATINEKLRKAELRTVELQAELVREKEDNQDLLKVKTALEKQVTELNLRVLDLETKASTTPRGVKRLESRLEELSAQLEQEMREKNETLKSLRKTERTIRELQWQLSEKDKIKLRYEDDITKYEQKVARMRQNIEELQNSESALQLGQRRATREANESRERSLRLEREVEKMKSRLDRSSVFSE
ncbi:4224_t:CDS:10 [Paraglomus brasilianum]|uniref:4224_t:CDS:1 n=1 Tax=Paraglomus brasilianum TaxID=144538 RepID=A0A9N9AG30_9GLOM|nr:4224_t:CDS:10 [Paraglomus brasilianum]